MAQTNTTVATYVGLAGAAAAAMFLATKYVDYRERHIRKGSHKHAEHPNMTSGTASGGTMVSKPI